MVRSWLTTVPVEDLLPRTTAAGLFLEPADAAFDLDGPSGFDGFVPLTSEAPEQLGRQLGAFVDGETEGGRQYGLGLLGHVAIIGGIGLWAKRDGQHRLGRR